MGIGSGNSNRSTQKNSNLTGTNRIINVPSNWVVNEMITDVSITGYSKWNLGENITLEINKRNNGDRVLSVITPKDDLSVREIIEITKPFFKGVYHNAIKNNHDGTYEVSLDPQTPLLRNQKTKENKSNESNLEDSLVPNDYPYSSYVVQEMLSDLAHGKSSGPWRISEELSLSVKPYESEGGEDYSALLLIETNSKELTEEALSTIIPWFKSKGDAEIEMDGMKRAKVKLR